MSKSFQRIIIALSIALSACSEQHTYVNSIESRIDSLTAPHAKANTLSGTILVAQKDKVLFHQSYGYANWELKAPISDSTRFGIASITKPFTEIIVAMLVNEQKLKLNDPVEKYLAGFPRGPQGGIPLIAHLVDHEAGVPHRVTTQMEETQPITPSQLVEYVKAKGLLFDPGTKGLYSSAGYTCLSRIIEIVEGKSYEEVLINRVFKPSGMTYSMNETGSRLMPGRAYPYRLGSDEQKIVVCNAPYKDLRFLTGAGSVYSTPKDLLNFVKAMKAGKLGENPRIKAIKGDTAAWISWTGRTNGYESSIDVFPAKDIVFIFLSNLQSASNWQLRGQIQNVLMGNDPDPTLLPPAVVKPFESPESLVGLYGSAEILLVDGKLFRGENEFYPIENNMYYIPASGSKMRFRRDSAGNVDALISINGNGNESILNKSR